jgi:hypothetical protein
MEQEAMNHFSKQHVFHLGCGNNGLMESACYISGTFKLMHNSDDQEGIDRVLDAYFCCIRGKIKQLLNPNHKMFLLSSDLPQTENQVDPC